MTTVAAAADVVVLLLWVETFQSESQKVEVQRVEDERDDERMGGG